VSGNGLGTVPERTLPLRKRGLISKILIPCTMLLAVAVLVAQQHGLILHSSPVRYLPWKGAISPTATADLGVTTLPLARNAWESWTPGDLQSVNAFEQAGHIHASIVMWYADWAHAAAPSLSQLNAVDARGSVPEITWEPWNALIGPRHPQPLYALRNIIAGRFDPYIERWAHDLAAWGKPVRIRFAQEMNGNWYPWGQRTNGNQPGDFVRMWRHVHHIFALAGASNVRWVWSPVPGAPRYLYPGRGEVNTLGVTCLNGGNATFHRGWRSFATICRRAISQLHAMDPGLPIEISEAGTVGNGAQKAQWIANMFRFLATVPTVRTVIWFDLLKGVDWRVQSSPVAERAFARAVGSGRFR
jgi:glycosyl hydrolase family 26